MNFLRLDSGTSPNRWRFWSSSSSLAEDEAAMGVARVEAWECMLVSIASGTAGMWAPPADGWLG